MDQRRVRSGPTLSQRGLPRVLCAERIEENQWRLTGGGGNLLHAGAAVEPPLPAQPGLCRIGGGTGGVLRHTVGAASEQVSAIRLRNDRGVREIPLGCTRFFVLGTTHHDPITYASGVDRAGNELDGSPLLL